MKLEELQHYKQIYSDIAVSDNFVGKKWELLMPLLPKQNEPDKYTFFPPYAVAFLTMLVLFIGTVGMSQAAKPGDSLYPVKIFTQGITTNLADKLQKTTEKIVPSIMYKKSKTIPTYTQLPEKNVQATPSGKNVSGKEEMQNIDQSNKPTATPTVQQRGNSEAAKQNQEVKGAEVKDEHVPNSNSNNASNGNQNNDSQRGNSKK